MKKNTSTKQRAVAYVRTATYPSSAKRQEAAVRAVARLHGLQLVGIRRDRGVSGNSGVRPGLICLMADLEKARASVVITTRPDRLARNAELMEAITHRIAASGAQLIFAYEVGSDEPRAS